MGRARTWQQQTLPDLRPILPHARARREAPPQIPAALMQEAEVASDDMKATTGIYDSAWCSV